MEKVLLLNGSHSEISLLRELKNLGKYVITTGNLPDSFVHKYADEYIQADYSDMNKIADIAIKNNISGVVSCANDFGIITASYVAEIMGLKGHDSFEVTTLLHQKDKFKKFAIEYGMQVPFSQEYHSEDNALQDIRNLEYPVIVKPVDLTGGKGVSKVSSDDEFMQAVHKAFDYSRKKIIVVERFIEGTYHSFSTFLVDKRVIGFFSDNEYSNVYRFFVDTSAGPADYQDINSVLIGQAEFVAEKLNLVNGVFHMQYVMDKKHKPYIIDITRRCSGDVYPEPVEHSTGLPWSKWIVMSELGYPSDIYVERGKQTKFCGRHCIMADTEGTVEDVIIDSKLKEYVYKNFEWWKPGYRISNHFVDKLGILFYEFPSRDIMNDIVKNIKKFVTVKIK